MVSVWELVNGTVSDWGEDSNGHISHGECITITVFIVHI